MRAVPIYPGEPNDCVCLLRLHRSCGLHHLRQAGRSHLCVSRLYRVRLRYGSHRAPPEAPPPGLLPSTLSQLHGLQAFHMVTSFGSQERPGLAWRTGDAENRAGDAENFAPCPVSIMRRTSIGRSPRLRGSLRLCVKKPALVKNPPKTGEAPPIETTAIDRHPRTWHVLI